MSELSLPIGSIGRRSSGWFGVWMLVATEAALFAYLLFAYFYLALQTHRPWPTGGLPSLGLSAGNTLILLSSSVAAWWGERGLRRGAKRQLTLGMSAAFVLGGTFAGVQLLEWHSKSFTFNSDLYGSLFFTITGFHLAHVVVGLAVLAALAVWSALGYFDATRRDTVAIGALYWHFVDAVWLFVFATLYVTPYLGLRT
jgi:heme/copper-type cytochrome/quinol oxidase subunit 3